MGKENKDKKEIKIQQKNNNGADLFWGLAKHFEHKKDSSVCIDIGSCYGNYARHYSCLFKKIICFEPNIYLTNGLQKTLEWTNNIEVHMVALGKRYEKNKTFYVTSWNPIKNGKERESHWRGVSSFDIEYLNWRKDVLKESIYYLPIEVEVRTLDSYELAPSFIKIDAEKSEVDIIEGGKQTILKYKPTLQIEGKAAHNMILDLGYIHLPAKSHQLNYMDNIYVYNNL